MTRPTIALGTSLMLVAQLSAGPAQAEPSPAVVPTPPTGAPSSAGSAPSQRPNGMKDPDMFKGGVGVLVVGLIAAAVGGGLLADGMRRGSDTTLGGGPGVEA